tara:strand:+ start:508 stop:1029 length:522 start_codon:yes stop_codon:yes gene_type:complete
MPLTKLNATLGLTGALPAVSGANLTGVSAGKILAVYQVRTNTAVTVNSTSYMDIGLSQAVTPASSSSKFLLMPKVHHWGFGGGEGFNLKIVRAISGGASTNINAVPTNGNYLFYQDATANSYRYGSYDWLDSPSTASAITYTCQAAATSSHEVKLSGYNNETYSMLTIFEVSS